MTELVEFRGRDGNRLAADAAGDPGRPAGGAAARRRPDPPLVGHDARDARRARAGAAYSVDLRGHGDSEWAADGDYTLDAFAGDVLAIAARSTRRPRSSARRSAASRRSPRSASTPTTRSRGRSCSSTSRRASRKQGRMRIGEFMTEHMDDGFGSLDEVADAIQRYNPHRPRPDATSTGSRRTCASATTAAGTGTGIPAFIGGRLGGPDETRVVARRSRAAAGRGARAHASRRCWCAAG